METDHQEEGTRQEPLGFALGAAARKLAKFYVQALADYPLTPSQLFLLRHLWIEEGLSLRDLGLRSQLDATSITWLADQLEQAGLIERKRSTNDRRIVRVWLTEAGRQSQARLTLELEHWENVLYQELVAHHTPDEVAAFRQVLTTLINTLPEGDDLWEQLSTAWDTRLDRLRSLAETTMEKDCEVPMEKMHLTGRSIEKELFINASPERVFRALTDKEELEHWFLRKAEIDLRPGGQLRFEWRPGVFNYGKILVLEPPHRLSYTWEVQTPDVTVVTFELVAQNDGTLLRVTNAGYREGEDWDSYYNLRNNGWDVHLGNLAAWLETGKESVW